jgi:hypothetical protein
MTQPLENPGRLAGDLRPIPFVRLQLTQELRGVGDGIGGGSLVPPQHVTNLLGVGP